MLMTKQEAIELFGGGHRALAEALGISRSAVSQWPQELDQEREDRVIGAAVRLGIELDARLRGVSRGEPGE